MPRLEGWNVVVLGLGTAKAAAKYAEWTKFPGVIGTDPDKLSYVAMGWEKQPDGTVLSKGLAADKDAKRLLTGLGGEAGSFLIGGGLTSATQNGGVVVVTAEGKVPFAYRSHGSWDMPDTEVLIKAINP